MARPGAAARRRQECPARAQVASCPPPARPEPPRAGPGARAGGSSAWDTSCQAAPSAGPHPFLGAAVSGALSSQQLSTRSLPSSWGPSSGTPTQAKAQGRQGRIGQLGLSQPARGIDASPKATVAWRAPHPRPSRSRTSLEPVPLELLAMRSEERRVGKECKA